MTEITQHVGLILRGLQLYFYGVNLGWLAGGFLALFVTAGILAASVSCIACAAIFALPKKHHIHSGIIKIFLGSALAAIAGIVGTGVVMFVTVSNRELEAGRHWKTECKLMEVNIQTGVFSEPVNKLDCAGVIINVRTRTYNRYILEWQSYENDKNNVMN